VVAAQHQQPDGRLGAFVFRSEHDRLDGALERDIQQLGDGFALRLARRGGLFHRFGGRRALCDQRQGFGRFDVCRKLRGRAIGDRVFARVGDHVKLMRTAAADRAVVRRHRAEVETEAREDTHIGVVHLAIRLFQTVLVLVERVRIFHDEFAAAHQAETRTDLVAELRLDLIEVHRHLPVALDLVAGDVRDHFLVRRPDHEIALLAVLETQQFRPVFFPAARLLPQFGRLHRRHQQFDRARPVHFLAHDGFHLADRAQADGQVVIDAAGHATDHAGAHHELVADDFGVSGGFFEGADKETGSFHSEFFQKRRRRSDRPKGENGWEFDKARQRHDQDVANASQTCEKPLGRSRRNSCHRSAAAPDGPQAKAIANAPMLRRNIPIQCDPLRQVRYLFIIKAILKDSKVVVCWIVKAFARTSASSS
jgi:hypothetical protein